MSKGFGTINSWQFGVEPSKECKIDELQITFPLKALTDANTAAQESADATLQANIDAEAAARVAADGVLQAGLDNEGLARQAADNALQADIGANTSSIVSNSSLIDINTANINNIQNEISTINNRIVSVETEIGDAPTFSNSRIDQSVGAASNILDQGVLYTDSGSIGHDGENYYRTLTYNRVTGDLIFRAEFNHSLDEVSINNTVGAEDGYWYCTVGDQIMNGHIAKAVLFRDDDASIAKSLGFKSTGGSPVLCEDGCWAYMFKNKYGLNLTSTPYFKIQVYDPNHPDQGKFNARPNYVLVVPTPEHPVRGWFFGNRDIDSFGGPDQVYVGLSNPDLIKLLRANYPNLNLPTGDDHVVVDLDDQEANLLFKPDGSPR